MEKTLYLFNTATQKKEVFTPVHPPRVGMYCCGLTVYNFAHIGNLRTYIFEDVLRRTLHAAGYTLTHVMNVTDVGHLSTDEDTGEDKMEQGSIREGKNVWEIAQFYTKKFIDDMHDLNILEPDIMPKATDHIAEMIELVRTLEKKGFTYRTDDGIYFDTTKFGTYRSFARLDPESLQAGIRVDMGQKRHPTDFALWKFSPTDKKRQMEWESPWGRGFPGWHIECSAMSLKYLPQPIDIHCGGIDHIRIHHTNEIAQVEAATGKQYVRFWMHGEFLIIDKGKMSKSAGHFITLDSLKQRHVPALAYRMFCYSAHYRSPLAFSWEGLEGAAHSLQTLKRIIRQDMHPGSRLQMQGDIDRMLDPFWEAVFDDLNMPKAMAAVWEIARSTGLEPALKIGALMQADSILGLDLFKADETVVKEVIGETGKTIRIVSSSPVPPQLEQTIVTLASQRLKARAEKQFARADELRVTLKEQGVTVADLPDGSCECRV